MLACGAREKKRCTRKNMSRSKGNIPPGGPWAVPVYVCCTNLIAKVLLPLSKSPVVMKNYIFTGQAF